MSEPAEFSHKLRISDLPADRPHVVTLQPDVATRAQIAASLDIPLLRKLRFDATLAPLGQSDWQLTAKLGATVVQDCVVTLDPVTTRIDEVVSRTYLASLPELPDDEEVEMPDDETVEALPATLDLGAVLLEALTLAVPAYPHSEGVAPVNQAFAEPGVTPLDDEATKPFAGLAALRDKLSDDQSD